MGVKKTTLHPGLTNPELVFLEAIKKEFELTSTTQALLHVLRSAMKNKESKNIELILQNTRETNRTIQVHTEILNHIVAQLLPDAKFIPSAIMASPQLVASEKAVKNKLAHLREIKLNKSIER